jgi:hypothetical protein
MEPGMDMVMEEGEDKVGAMARKMTLTKEINHIVVEEDVPRRTTQAMSTSPQLFRWGLPPKMLAVPQDL